eukprot:2496143-Prymnesium_polylepis.2
MVVLELALILGYVCFLLIKTCNTSSEVSVPLMALARLPAGCTSSLSPSRSECLSFCLLVDSCESILRGIYQSSFLSLRPIRCPCQRYSFVLLRAGAATHSRLITPSLLPQPITRSVFPSSYLPLPDYPLMLATPSV